MSEPPFWKLRGEPALDAGLKSQLERDYARFARDGLPADLDEYLRDRYRLDLRSTFAGLPVKNPWGKASGQLSMTVRQVEEDADAGLGFVVLKTVIAQDETGEQAMRAWAIKEAKMLAERIVGKRTGREGWTITWKGRGWWQSFDEYLQLVTEAVALGRSREMVVVPSCKYHLPTPEECGWKEAEYRYTTERLTEAFSRSWPGTPTPIEKDFSPTLAGSDRARQKEKILEWLRTVPRLVRRNCSAPVRIGLKLFNAMFEDEFQVEMLRQVLAVDNESRPDFLTYANRLFDPHKTFEGTTGVAYGGPDLSDRNLQTLDAYMEASARGEAPALTLPLSATGDIHTGRMALEYALRGCSTFQIHTFFQLPAEAYDTRVGSKVSRALHRLYFDPKDGFIAWLRSLAERSERVAADGTVQFVSAVGLSPI